MIIQKKLSHCRSIREFAYFTIKDNIVNLTLKPGQKVTELELVDELKIGKTPIREALIQLAQESLVNIIPQSGTFISKIDLSSVEEGHYIRSLVEEDIHIQAMRNITPEQIEHGVLLLKKHQLIPIEELHEHWEQDFLFHRHLYSVCNKENTFEWIQHINSDYNRIRLLVLTDLPKAQTIIEEHMDILDGIKNKDEDKIRNMTKKHLNKITVEKEIILDTHRDYFKEV